MIEFVFGREPSSKTEYVIEQMKKALDAGKKCILIMPEQQALAWDTVVAKRFLATDAFNIETVSFRRLANSVFRKFGGVSKKYINEGQKALYMWGAVDLIHDKLKAFDSIERLERHIPRFIAGTNELRLYGITPEKLLEAAQKMGSGKGSLPDRLSDLAYISAAYNTLLSDDMADPTEIPDALCAILENNDYFHDTCVFIDSFYTLTPKEIKVAEHIFRQASDVFVTFAMEESDIRSPHMEYVTGYMKTMARLASRLGLDIKKTSVCDGRKKEFSYLSKYLWDYSAEPLCEETDRVTVIKCPDRYDEAILAGAKIKELCARGASFSDIACVAADFEMLRGITDIELEMQGIPVYVSGKTSVTSQPAVRLILSALSVISGGWKKENIIACARTGLCDLTPDETDALQLYTDIWRINGKKSYTEGPWTMNADGYTNEERPWGLTLLSLANSAREKLIPPLERFSEAIPGTIKDICRAIYEFLCDFRVYDRLKLEVSALEGAGKFSDAQKKSQVWDAVCSVLDTLVSTIPLETANAHRFTTLFRHTSDACLIGTIPDGIDRVALGSVGSMRLDAVKHLIVLGAKSGEFPKAVSDSGFFSDADREAMRDAGLEISPDTVSKQREEMFRFSETVSSPSESLTVIIPSDGSQIHPSTGALRLMKLLPKAKVYDFSTPDAESILRTRGKLDSVFNTGALSADNDRTTGAALARLFDRDINLTQSRIECFNSCPFKYYCEYILRLSENSTAEFRHSEVGNFVHSVLENFMREASKDSFPISKEALISKADRLMGQYREEVLPDNPCGHVEYMFDRLSRSIRLFAETLNEEFAQSRFSPYSFELKVGFSDDLPAIPIRLDNGHDLTVRGIVDRMDILREDGNVYIRVVDYKTGSKKFSLDKVMKGENIQLLLYLFALCNMPSDCGFAKRLAPDGERLVPAGAVYFSAKPGETAAGDLLSREKAKEFAADSISRTGIVLGDTELIRAMDSDLTGKFAPAYVNEKGQLKGSFAKSEEDFHTIKSALDRLLKDVGDRMTKGDAASAPTGYGQYSSCTYCAMKPLCRHSDHTNNTEEMGGESDE